MPTTIAATRSSSLTVTGHSPATPRQPGTPSASPPLWKQIAATAQAVHAVRTGQSATTALAAVPGSLRPGVQALLFDVLRHLGLASALRERLARKAPPPPVDALLCVALALCLDGAQARYTPFTLVNQTVEAARRQGLHRQTGFINACLRRFLQERDACLAAVRSNADDLSAQWNHPAWWVRKLQAQYPRDWQRILHASNAHAPMTLRVNRRLSTPAVYLEQLRACGLDAHAVGESGVLLHRPVAVEQLPGWAQGLVSVQDMAAQLAAPLLLSGLPPAAPHWRVLDACAAPGGKTAHLLESCAPGQLHVVALEIQADRAHRIHDTLQRTGVADGATVLVADAGAPQHWWRQAQTGQPDGGQSDDGPHSGGLLPLFDAILLDAPCSASGIVRRRPDVRWLRRESDIAQLAAVQARLLDALWPLLKPGGRMLYATCSIFREEGEDQIRAFVSRQRDARRLPAPGHLLPCGPAGAVDANGLAAATTGAPRGTKVAEPVEIPLQSAGDDGLPRTQARDNAPYNHDGFFYALLHKDPHAASGTVCC